MSEVSMDDTIREAMKGMQSPLTEEAVEVEKPEVVVEDKPQVGRARDESGKFVKADVGIDKPDVTDQTVKPVEEKPVRRAPNTWRKQAAEKWGSIDPDIQDEIERREADIRNGIEQYRSKAQAADAFEQAIAPYRATLNGFGIPPHEAIGRLLATEHGLRYGNAQQKAAAFRQLAADYGVELTGLAKEAPQIDPNLAALQQELGQLRSQLAQRETFAQQSEMQRLNSQISEFAKSHPHFESVRESMGRLIEAGLATDLDEAYEKALWASPDLRQTLLAEQQEKARQEATRKTEEARKAAAVNVPVKGTVASAAPVGSMDDTIRAAVKRSGYFN